MFKFKFLLVLLALLVFGSLSPAVAADDPVGKVTSIDGNIVTVQVTGDMPVWAKKGAYLRTTTMEGKVIFRGAKITAVEGNVITVNTVRAKEKTVGTTYKIFRGKPSAGC
ncbi:MAG: hypothetical protein Q8T13_01245 [Acidobacteriota bacterium]|nr:hypothetical protein [Acidobacteriota bacterium]